MRISVWAEGDIDPPSAQVFFISYSNENMVLRPTRISLAADIPLPSCWIQVPTTGLRDP